MMGRQINITIDKEGNTKYSFSGFQGRLCYAEMEKLKQLLKKQGVDVTLIDQEPTPESYVGVQQVVKNVA